MLRFACLLTLATTLAVASQAQTCPYANLNSQAAVDAFNCTVVEGFLDVLGADVTDLTPLRGLTHVGGRLNLQVNHVLTSLSGLEDLESVGGNVYINLTQLQNLDGLRSLQTVGDDFVLDGNASLENVDGLAALTSVGRDLYIFENPQLTDLDGLTALTTVGRDLRLLSNTGLRNVSGLRSLSRLGEDLYIWACDGLVDLTGLSALREVVGVTLRANSELTTLDGLGPLTTVLDLDIRDNPRLTSVHGFDAITDLWALRIEGNALLTSLQGLNALKRVTNGVRVRSNASLASLAGLEQLRSAQFVMVDGDALVNIGALNGLTDVSLGLTIASSPRLTTLPGFDGLTSTSRIQIVDNDALTAIDGFPNIASLQGLSIHDNDALRTLGGFDALTSVQNLVITENDRLDKCRRGLNGLISGGAFTGVSGTVTIQDNAPGSECTSPAAVLQATPSELGPDASLALSVTPNPAARGTARVAFALAEPSRARIAVYDALGREVALLADEDLASGDHEAALPGTLGAGIYVVRVEAGGSARTETITVVR